MSTLDTFYCTRTRASSGPALPVPGKRGPR
nr:MAG TPA_asm: hypothetical protein [Caudoviricetes sp.]